jgi:predicted HicB family RNase H-like nuclease
MNKPATPKPKRGRGQPPKKILKTRPSITIDPAIWEATQKAAFNAGLSASAWLEQLVRSKLKASV